ncbi:uncharacterized protein LOC122659225 [Telopea speciosissima]|uniref:uncharacterized protein LOC122659225 n=1 Tax=Telopea speciosissima TaxID=54955 RepID=UPI001CC58D67|nr:uncharacterized protein LOC122659225 [Telopea speciosissima]
MAPAVTVNPTTVASENSGRVYSDDEPSGHGAPVGFRKLPQPQLQQKMGVDLPSPDAAARDANSRPKPVFYQDPVAPASPARDNRVLAIHVPFGAAAAAASSPTRSAAIPNDVYAHRVDLATEIVCLPVVDRKGVSHDCLEATVSVIVVECALVKVVRQY